jgi:hypothetical protein
MRTQTTTQAFTTLALAGMLIGGTSSAQFISGERALLNRVEVAPATSARSQHGPIDPASALLGRTAGRSGFPAMAGKQSNASPALVGAERALLGHGA